ncbi:LOW QUALITY PROTEIN: hypothetical protein PanWU01x14_222430 [Parasponia andersonii]|uniref:Uncharacterized protein n=1 Tax=Parasponia andersonii TaxID=3476 RepID=A0A2P5BNZ7_PARAD|nr:LOW QUALITY PROTEIN: hypothetical protein PanWU01x14_222430 [Parasponia andersonii]
MVRMEKMTKEPGGILKWGVRFRSVVLARTDCWLTIAAMKMPVDQIGMTLRMALSSSTCFTVDRLHGSSAKPSGVREWGVLSGLWSYLSLSVGLTSLDPLR